MSRIGTPATIDDRYHLGRLLGRGGMAAVYRASDARTGQAVAVKLFSSAVSSDDRVRQRREASLAASLDHPGIVRLLDSGCADGDGARLADDTDLDALVFLVAELVDGPTLREKVARKPLSPEQVTLVGARMADSLSYLHSRGVVHRDVKPANILLPGYGDDALAQAKLADFGVAVMIDDTRVTRDGQVVGTPNYLSPEQVSGESLVIGSDVYSLGLVLLEALTGRPSFPGTGVETALARLTRRPVVPLDAPPWLASVLVAMTSPRPEDRPSADAVGQQLRDGEVQVIAPTAVLPDLGFALMPNVQPVPALPDDPTAIELIVPPRRSAWRWAVAAAAVIALVGAIGLVANSSSGARLPLPGPSLPASQVAQQPTSSVATGVSTSTRPAVVTAKKTSARAAPPAPTKPNHGPGHGKHGPGH